MKKNLSIQLKAAFLLTVFALNIVVGFACAIGMDMGFNAHHHHEDGMEAMEHVHADGSKHLHQNQTVSHGEETKNTGANDDNCCKDRVTKIAQADKAVPQSYNGIHPVFFTAFLTAFCSIDIVHYSSVTKDVKPFLRSYHPPIPNIRIAIQSFQI